MATNKYHALVCALCRREGWPEPVAEAKLIPGRRFACDFAWPTQGLVLEIQGGIWLSGRRGHSGGTGQARDIEKFNLLALQGYRVLQTTPRGVTDGTLQRLLAEAFRAA